MKFSSIFAISALLLGMVSLAANSSSSKNIQLIDLSSSYQAISSSIQNDPSKDVYYFSENISPNRKGIGEQGLSNLGAALKQLRMEIDGDVAIEVFTDGVASDILPDPTSFEGFEFEWVETESRVLQYLQGPRFGGQSTHLSLVAGFNRPGAGTLHLDFAGKRGIEILSTTELDSNHLLIEAVISKPELGGLVNATFQDSDSKVLSHATFVLPPMGESQIYSNAPHRLNLDSIGIDKAQLAVLYDLGPGSIADDLNQLKQQGCPILLLSKRPSFWSEIPSAYRPFLSLPKGSDVAILLDTSGSVTEETWANLQTQLESAFGQEEANIWTFAADLNGPFSWANERDRALLRKHSLYGSTDLAGALDSFKTQGNVLLLFSDGHDSAKGSTDWQSLGRSLRDSYRQVICIPMGNSADLELLQSLGEISHEPASLLAGIDSLNSYKSSLFVANKDLWLDLPAKLKLTTPIEVLMRAPKAISLLKDVEGGSLLASRAFNGNFIYGMQTTEPKAVAVVLDGISGHTSNPSIWVEDNWVYAENPAPSWSVNTGELDEELAFEAIGENHFRAGPFSLGDTLWLQTESGNIPLRTIGEFSGINRSWRNWLHRQSQLRAVHRSPAKLPILITLILITVSFGLRRYGV